MELNDLPDDVIEQLLLRIENLEDVRKFFRLNRRMHSFAIRRRVFLMWIEKHRSLILAFMRAVELGEDQFARERIAKMTLREKLTSMVDALHKGFARQWITRLLDARYNNILFGYPGGRKHLLHFPVTAEAAATLLAVPGMTASVNVEDSEGNTPLHFAAWDGYTGVVAELLKVPGIDINKRRQSDGMSALFNAAANGHTEVVQMLLRADGILPNVRDNQSNTPLHAAANASVETVHALLADERVDVNAVNSRHQTAAFLAVAYNRPDIFQELAAAEGVMLGAVDNHGCTVLHMAACKGHEATLRAVLDVVDADMIGALDDNLYIPLHTAVEFNQLKSVDMLLAAQGVNVNATDNRQRTPLHIAASKGYTEIISAILAAHGVNINARDQAGMTPLHLAVRHGHAAAVTLLLQAVPDVNVNATDNRQQTPLHIAAAQGNLEIINAILAAPGVNINARDETDTTPLYYAAAYGHADAITLLLTTDVNIKSEGGVTALHAAVIKKDMDCVNAILASPYVDVNARDVVDRTPLHYAVRIKLPAIVKRFLDTQGINVNCRDEDGDTPLHYAAKQHHIEVMEMLLTYKGVDISALNNKRHEPLFYANKKRRTG